MNRFLVLLVCLCVACNGRGCPLKKKFDGGGTDAANAAGWGTVTDPEGDCTVVSQGGRLTITVPNTPHDLNPVAGMSAPRVLQEVKGDFVVTVKVTGEFEPVLGFNGAGLLVWADSRNYVRLERNRYTVPGQAGYFCYPPLYEYYKNGVYQNTDPLPVPDDFRGSSLWLRLERRGSRLACEYSFDGREWRQGYAIAVDLPERVQVGVAAVNTSQKPFTVTFEEFSVAEK
jgi:hypothetical protein